MAADKVAKTKEEVDDTLEGYRAVVIEDDHAEACITGLGHKPLSAVFKLLESCKFLMFNNWKS